MAKTSIESYFKSQGCTLIDEYKGCLVKMRYICKCGNEGFTSWNNFSRGRRCGRCSKYRNRYSYEDVKKEFFSHGCELLEDSYKGFREPMKYRCRCGRISITTFTVFHHQYQNCLECGKEKNRKEKHHAWRSDRDKFEQEKKFRKKMYKALSSTLQCSKQKKWARTHKLLGYTHIQLMEHITSHSNWPMVKDGNWHIDHIFPINAFIEHDITDPKIVNHLTNLRPLSQKENNEKWATYDKDAFKQWLSTL